MYVRSRVADISNGVALDDPRLIIFQNELHVVYGDETNSHVHLRRTNTWVRETLADPAGSRAVAGSAEVYIHAGSLHIVSRAGTDGHLVDFPSPAGTALVDLSGAHRE